MSEGGPPDTISFLAGPVPNTYDDATLLALVEGLRNGPRSTTEEIDEEGLPYLQFRCTGTIGVRSSLIPGWDVERTARWVAAAIADARRGWSGHEDVATALRAIMSACEPVDSKPGFVLFVCSQPNLPAHIVRQEDGDAKLEVEPYLAELLPHIVTVGLNYVHERSDGPPTGMDGLRIFAHSHFVEFDKGYRMDTIDMLRVLTDLRDRPLMERNPSR